MNLFQNLPVCFIYKNHVNKHSTTEVLYRLINKHAVWLLILQYSFDSEAICSTFNTLYPTVG